MKMIEKQMPAFTMLSELASTSAGGKVLFSTDDFFATCENMLADTEPIFIADKYTEFGKWMDGWETRRKRIPGHDWCIIKLATKCIIKGFLIDTAYFTGNNAPKFSVQAATLSRKEEDLIPQRTSKTGSACSVQDLAQISMLKTDEWVEIVPPTALQPGYEETRLNFQKVLSDEAWTHIRVNIYPDGGIARLRVFGEVRPDVPFPDEKIDLISVLNGATLQEFSNAHYGHPSNIIKPCQSESMADGWETARKLDRPKVVEANEDGTLKISGQEWAMFKLGFPGRIHQICVDTTHFKGNYPDSVKVEGIFLSQDDWDAEASSSWVNILNPSKLSAHKEHWFESQSDLITHVRVTIAPDGGISRIKMLGYVDNSVV